MNPQKPNPEPMRLLDAEIRHATLVWAPPERVFDALTTASSLDGWFTHGASVEARPGSEIHFRWVNWGPDRVTDEDGGPGQLCSRLGGSPHLAEVLRGAWTTL